MAEEAARSAEHRPRLGRGLATLLGSASEEPTPEPTRARRKTAIEFVRPNPRNVRKNFSESEIEDLTASIRERGVIQPILVRPAPGVPDAYEIIAGERRWRAAQRAGLHEVPIIVIEASDKDALAIAIIENIQRADLNALEEANGYAQLMDEHGYSQAEVSHVVGKSRSHIANTLRLRNLPERTRALLAAGEISAGHARALLALANPDAVAQRIIADGLTVRDVERLGQAAADRRAEAPRRKAQPMDPDTRALQDRIAEALGTKVVIRHDGERGEIRLSFQSFEQLDDICNRLAHPAGGA